jgi:P27 family predicted phage terminase small subunit
LKSGPKPTPSKLKLLRGNPGRRPLNPAEPECEPATLDPPAWLEGDELLKWQETAPELLAAGLLATIDTDALLSYCNAWARWRVAEAHIKKHGPIIAAPSGYPVHSPYLAIADKALARMQAFQSEFGMSPSARSRVHVKGTAKKSAAQKFQESAPKLKIVAK